MTMLDRMRRHKAWLKWFLALVAVAMCLYLIPDFLTGTTSTAGTTAATDVLATVDGREITARDFDMRYQSQLQSYREQFGSSVSESVLKQFGIEQQVLRQLIEEQVASIEAARQGIRVSNDELAVQILSLPLFQEGNGQFVGDERYRQILQSMNPPLTVGQFEDEFRRGLALDKLRTSLTGWMAVSDAELEREYKERNEKVKMQVVALTAGTFRTKVSASDADVAAHFESNKESYRVGEQRQIRYFVIDQSLAKLKVMVTPNEVQRDYNNDIDRYRTPEQIRASHILLKTEGKSEADVRTKAEAILKEVKGGADFAAVAKRESEDEMSKASGGDLSYFSRGRMVPEFDTAAFAMQTGQTSDLVKSQFGFHIIRVTDRKPEVTRPLDEVRADIQDRLTMQKTNRLIADEAGRIAANIKTADDLDKGAAEAGTKVVTSEFFPRQSPIPGIGASQQTSEAVFRLKDTNEVAGPVDTPRGPAFVALVAKKDSYVPKLDEVKDRVREDVIKARAADMARQRAGEIAATLRSARDFSAAAKGLGLEAKETTLIPRGSPLPDVGASKDIDAAAFALPVGGVSAPISTDEATVIVKVTERDDATPEELQKDRETFRAEILNERRDRFFASYMTKARERTTVQINNDVVRRVLNERGL